MSSPLITMQKAGWAILEEQRGSEMRVQIGSTADIPCNLMEVTLDEIIVAGGKAEKGAAKFIVAQEDCPDGTIPAKNTVCTTSDGDTGYILGVTKLHGLLTILIGDPSGRNQGEHGFI